MKVSGNLKLLCCHNIPTVEYRLDGVEPLFPQIGELNSGVCNTRVEGED
jgi:hypothetical protein